MIVFFSDFGNGTPQSNPACNAYTISRCKECPYSGDSIKLAKVPDNELCQACKVVREMKKNNIRLQEQRNEIRSWAKDNIIGKTVLVHGIKNPVEFTVSGIKEALNQPHKYIRAKNEAIYDLIDLLKEAEYLMERLDEKGNPMVLKYHYLRIKISEHDSYAVVRELIDGRCQLYSIVERLKKQKRE